MSFGISSFKILFVEEHMYRMLNAFMLLKPAMDTGNVPEFYTFFNSSAVEVKFNILKKINCLSQRCQWLFLLIVRNWWMNYIFPDKLVLNYLLFINFLLEKWFHEKHKIYRYDLYIEFAHKIFRLPVYEQCSD